MEKVLKYLEKINCDTHIDIDELNSLSFDLSFEEKMEIKDLLELKGIEVHICSQCGDFLDEGYCAYGGNEYFCSDKCLYEVYDEKEWKKMCAYLKDPQERTDEEERWYEEYGDTESYYTQWY